MTASDLPTLTRIDVQNWTEPRFYDRGVGYVNEGRILRPRREDRTLKAECQGSQPAPYHVEAELDDDGIAWAECSCPMGSGGYCKHVVALLLTWIESPEQFQENEPLTEALKQRPKERLVELILKMVDRYPDLEPLVSVSAEAKASLDLDALRTRIEGVFQYPTGPHYHQYSLSAGAARDLDSFLTLADDCTDQGRPADAATVYHLIADVACDHYLTFADESGDLAHQVATCTEGLGGLLQKAEDPDLRDTILHALFDIYVQDLDLGGYGLGDRAPEIILDEASSDERARVAGWVQDALSDFSGSEEQRGFDVSSGESFSWDSNAWKREVLGGFLLDLEADALDDETYLRICRQSGRLNDFIDRLLALDRGDEAKDEARSASDLDLYRCASIFTEHGAEAAFRDLVRERLDNDPDRRLITWLRDDAQKQNRLEQALDLSLKLFWATTSVDAYESLRSIAEQLNRWEEVQSTVHEHLRVENNSALLTRLHLSDGDVKAALETLSEAERQSLWGSSRSLQLRVASAAEEEFPEAAIDIYTRRAEALIEDRGRKNYREAAHFLQDVKRLLEREDRADDWQKYLDTLYEVELQRLPAARDEFSKAGLL